ncbi:uncharacterized protein LOC143252221 [Tachypleus tridentatus]|uniref:uncharacterized protein LOC143252221 n=1 Tax=Tachypleus tridentatus TaxID=6853 RepID=UPI003FD1CE22
MATQLKSGYMLKYKKRIFGKDWREEYVVLFSDSTLMWFKDKGKMEPEGSVIIKNAPDLMAYGHFTARVPKKPILPNGFKTSQLIAFGTREKDTVYWFLCESEENVMSWMAIISNVLPPPPPPIRPSSQLPSNGCEGCSRNTFFPSDGLSQPQSDVSTSDCCNDDDLAMSLFLGTTMGWGLGLGWCGEWGWASGCHDIGNHWYNNGDHNFTNNQSDIYHESIGINDDTYDTGGLDSTDFDMCADFGTF